MDISPASEPDLAVDQEPLSPQQTNAPPTTLISPSMSPSNSSFARDQETDRILNSSSPIITDSHASYHPETDPNLQMMDGIPPLYSLEEAIEAGVVLPSIELSDSGGSGYAVEYENKNSQASSSSESHNGVGPGLGLGLDLGLGLGWEQNVNIEPEVERRPSFFNPAPAPAPMSATPRVQVADGEIGESVEAIASGVLRLSTSSPQMGTGIPGNSSRACSITGARDHSRDEI